MHPSTLLKILSAFGVQGISRRRRTSAKELMRRRFRPRVAQLEDRLVPASLTPSQVATAYGLNLVNLGTATNPVQADGAGQTIAIIDVGDDPTIRGDLKEFDKEFKLPAPPSFKIVGQNGGSLPPSSVGPDSGETALDVEWSHAMAPAANILLVESYGFQSSSIADAIHTAVADGASVVSMSLGVGNEYQGENNDNPTFSAGITGVKESGNTVTVTTNSALGYTVGTNATITGVDVGGYNGTYQITSVPTSDSFTYKDPNKGLGSSGVANASASILLVDDGLFAVPGVSFIAASGDGGEPGGGQITMSPDVLAVGATNLNVNSDKSYETETAWSNPATIVSATESGNVVTITTATPTGFIAGNYVQVYGNHGGYDGPNYNSDSFLISSINAAGTTFTYTDTEAKNLKPSSGGTVSSAGYSDFGGSGGGPSQYETQPSYQVGVVPNSMSDVGGTLYRTIPDVSMVGGSAWDVEEYSGGQGFGTAGTSVSTPCWAGLVADIDQGLALHGKPLLNTSLAYGSTLQTDLYNLYGLAPFDFHDIDSGYNGYDAISGYNMVTGLGSPVANLLIPDLVGVPGVLDYSTPSDVGTGHNIVITQDQADIDVFDNGFLVAQHPVSTTSQIDISGDATQGPISLTIDYSGGVFNVPVDFDGGTGSGPHVLNLPESASFSDETYLPGDNSINLDGNIISFYHLTSINDANQVGTLTVDDPYTGDTVQIVNGTGYDGFATTAIQSKTGAFPSLTVANKSSVTVVDTSSGKRDTYYVNNLAPATELQTLTIDSSAGSAAGKVNVEALGCALTVNSGSGQQSVYVGSAGSNLGGTLANIQGSISVEGSTELYVDDSGDATGQTMTLKAFYTSTPQGNSVIYDIDSTAMSGFVSWTAGGSGSVTGLIIYGGSGSNTWNVNATGKGYTTHLETGTGGATVNVTGTSGELDIDNEGGQDTVTVGNNAQSFGTGGSLAGIAGKVSVSGVGSTDLYVDDSGDGSAQTVSMYKGKIDWAALAPIQWKASSNASGSGVVSLNIVGGSGEDTFNVYGTSNFSAPTYLQSGSGNSSFGFVNLHATTGAITVDGADGGQWVTIGNGSVAGIQGAVNVVNSGSGYSYLEVNDSADAKIRKVTLSDVTISLGSNKFKTTVNVGSVTGLPNKGAITWDDGSSTSSSGGVEGVTIEGGKANDTFTVENTPNFYWQPGTESPTQLDLGDGGDTVNVEATTGSIGIDEGNVGTDTVNIGNASNELNGIQGAVEVDGNGNDILKINDQGSAAAYVYDVTNSSFSRTGTAAIGYGNQARLTINGSTVASRYDIDSTSAITTVNGNSSNDAFTVGDVSENFGKIGEALRLHSSGAGNSLVLEDQNDTTNGTYTAKDGSIQASYSAALTYTGIASVMINGSTSANVQYNIDSTASGTSLTVDTGSGTNAVNVTPGSKNLNNIAGSLSVHDLGGSQTTVTLNDQKVGSGKDYTVTSTNVTRAGTAGLVYSDVNVVLNAGNHGNTIDVQSTPDSSAVTVKAGTGNNVINVGDADSLGSLQPSSKLSINGQGGNNTLNLDDQATATGQTYAVNNNVVFASSLEILYTQITALVLNGAEGGNTFQIASTAAGTSYTLNGGTGGATFGVGSLITGDHNPLGGSILGPVTIQGQGGTNTVTVNDQNDTHAEEYKLGADSLQPTGTSKITFEGVNAVNVYGGFSGADTFVVTANPSATVTLNGGAENNSLHGPNLTNTWLINGGDAGSLNTTVLFNHIASLMGGRGVDVFQFQAGGSIGNINGGGAPKGQGDWLDYSAIPGSVSVNLVTGAASDVNGGAAGGVTDLVDGVNYILNVFGSQGGCTLTGDSTGNVLVGGAGADTIQGGTGRSLLIGNAGADQITGGSTSGGDILIGGTTNYDSDTLADMKALMAILAEWQSSDSYNTRFTKIDMGKIPGSDELNWGTTVHDDGAANVLTGAASRLELDWFFDGADDQLINFVAATKGNPGEHENNT